MGNSSSQTVHLAQPGHHMHPGPMGVDPRLVDPKHGGSRYRWDPRYGGQVGPDVEEEEFLHYDGDPTTRRPQMRNGGDVAGRTKGGKSASPADIQRRLGISPHNKVLPDVGVLSPKQILRPTEMGSILQQGGTITGRRRELLVAETGRAAAAAAAATRGKSVPSSSSASSSSPPSDAAPTRIVNGGGRATPSSTSSSLGKYERVRSKSAVVYAPDGGGGREQFDGGGASGAPLRNRGDRSASRGPDSRRLSDLERTSSSGARPDAKAGHWGGKNRFDSEPNLLAAAAGNRPRSMNALHPRQDVIPEAARDDYDRVDDYDDAEGGPAHQQRPRSRKKFKAPPAPGRQTADGLFFDGDAAADAVYDPRLLLAATGRKTPGAASVDMDYRQNLVVNGGGRKSASEFLSALWRRGAATPDPLPERQQQQPSGKPSKSGRMRLFRPKSESRHAARHPADDASWPPPTSADGGSYGRRSVSEIRPAYDDDSPRARQQPPETSRSGRLSKKDQDAARDAQMRRHRARSVDCLQSAAEFEDDRRPAARSSSQHPSQNNKRSSNNVSASTGNWVNAFSKSMTSLVPEHLLTTSTSGSARNSRPAKQPAAAKIRLFDPNDTIDSRKSKTSSRSARSKASVRSENKRKSRRDALSSVQSSSAEDSRSVSGIGSPSRLSAYAAAPAANIKHSKSIDNIFSSRSKSKSRDALDQVASGTANKPGGIEFGVQVLPRQFQKKGGDAAAGNNNPGSRKPVVAEPSSKPEQLQPQPASASAAKKQFYFGMDESAAGNGPVPGSSSSKPTSPERVSIRSGGSAVGYSRDRGEKPDKQPPTSSGRPEDEIEKFASRLQSSVVRTESAESYAAEGRAASGSLAASSSRRGGGGGEDGGVGRVNADSTISCCSDINGGDDENEADIPVKLRPVLPRKHLDMPRFSPTAAWRGIVTGQETGNDVDDPAEFARRRAAMLLRKQQQQHQQNGGVRKSSIGNNSSNSSHEHDLFEEQIIRESSSSRQNQHQLVGQHQLRHEKSADSGISGDADSPGPTIRAPANVNKSGNDDGDEEAAAVAGAGAGSSRPLAASSPVNHRPLSPSCLLVRNWTPEQDLDDSMGDGGSQPNYIGDGQKRAGAAARPSSNGGKTTPPKLTHSRNAMFPTFSLPRDDPLSAGKNKNKNNNNNNNKPPGEPQSFSSLRKLKRSVAGVPQQAGDQDQADSGAVGSRLPVDDNWSLSRSVPNSLDLREGRGAAAADRYRLAESWSDVEDGAATEVYYARDEEYSSRVTSDNRTSHWSKERYSSRSSRYRTNGHIVYLPEYKSVKVDTGEIKERSAVSRPRSAMLHHDACFLDEEEEELADFDRSVSRPHSVHGDAVEFAPPHRRRDTSPGSELLTAAAGLPGIRDRNSIVDVIKRKGKKFTYQSTIRQIERRRLEQQLSRDAEEKERQRIREQAVLQKVEEEFRRKRSREKSSIQIQLQELNGSGADDPAGPASRPQPPQPPHVSEKVLENGRTVIVAGKNMDTYAIPNKTWRPSPSSSSAAGTVQVRPFKSHPISIAEKSGILVAPPPPMSPPPPLTSDDYLPEPAPLMVSSPSAVSGSPTASSSSSSMSSALTGSPGGSDGGSSGANNKENPSSGSSGFFNGLRSRLGKGHGKSSASNKSANNSKSAKNFDGKGGGSGGDNSSNSNKQPSSDRSTGSLSPTRQDPEGAPASGAASTTASGGGSGGKSAMMLVMSELEEHQHLHHHHQQQQQQHRYHHHHDYATIEAAREEGVQHLEQQQGRQHQAGAGEDGPSPKSPAETIRREILAAARSRNGAASPIMSDEGVSGGGGGGKHQAVNVQQGQRTRSESRNRGQSRSSYHHLSGITEREEQFGGFGADGGVSSSGVSTGNEAASSSATPSLSRGGSSSRPSSSSAYSATTTTAASGVRSRSRSGGHHQTAAASSSRLLSAPANMNDSTTSDDVAATTCSSSSAASTASAATPVIGGGGGGAAVTAPPTLTKELSEFKEERRDYRDYVGPQIWTPRLAPSPYGVRPADGDIYMSSNGTNSRSESSVRTRSPGTRTPNGRRVGTPTSTRTYFSEKSAGLPVVSDNYRRDFVHPNEGPPPPPEKPVHYTHPEKVADLGKNPRVVTQYPSSSSGSKGSATPVMKVTLRGDEVIPQPGVKQNLAPGVAASRIHFVGVQPYKPATGAAGYRPVSFVPSRAAAPKISAPAAVS